MPGIRSLRNWTPLLPDAVLEAEGETEHEVLVIAAGRDQELVVVEAGRVAHEHAVFDLPVRLVTLPAVERFAVEQGAVAGDLAERGTAFELANPHLHDRGIIRARADFSPGFTE